MPPKFKKGENGDKDRVHLLGLDSSDEEEEEIFLNSSPNNPHHMPNRPSGHHDPKIKQVQNQVSGVISVMKDNISRVMERGEKLEDLEEKSGELADHATHFRHSSRRLQRKAWWQQCRLKLILAAIIAIILVIVIIIIVVRTRN